MIVRSTAFGRSCMVPPTESVYLRPEADTAIAGPVRARVMSRKNLARRAKQLPRNGATLWANYFRSAWSRGLTTPAMVVLACGLKKRTFFERGTTAEKPCRMTLNAVLLFCLLFPTYSNAQDAAEKSDQAAIIVVGAEGTEEYAAQFKLWAETWKKAASHTQLTVIGLDGDKAKSKTQLQQIIQTSAKDTKLQEVWLVMIGHGTFDGKRAKFNLHGPDVQADELNSWLAPLKHRLVVLNCASSSSPFINSLSAKNRIIVSASRSGFEFNYARFGRYLSESIDDPAIDLDKDGQTSILEAFCAASREVSDFYQKENRIATEHALLDDNGDGRGTPSDWFDGVRATKRPKEGLPDGFIANQVFLKRRGVENSLSADDRKIRDQLESQLEQIRLKKGKMDESEFLLKIEPVLLKLAKLYQQIEDLKNSANAPVESDFPANDANTRQ